MSLTVQQSDADRSQAARTEADTIFGGGAVVGITSVVAAMPNYSDLDAAAKASLLDLVEAIAIAVIRVNQNGTSKFPVQLPSYTVLGAPPASANTGNLIYVSNELGGAVVAFSDGTSWRRVTDRAVIT